MQMVDSEEFGWWLAYYRLEPFGPRRDDERAGRIVAIMAEVNRDRKVRSDPFVWTDFFPDHQPHPPLLPTGPNPEQLRSKILMWATRMNEAYEQGQMRED
jgi:hypothetical protein